MLRPAATAPLAAAALAAALLFTRPAGCQEPAPPAEQALEPTDRRNPSRRPTVALFWAEGFPTADAPVLTRAALDEALAPFRVEVLAGSEEVKSKLKNLDHDVLVLPYGSAFPLGGWTTIRGFLERGGGLVVLGGAPFHQPVRFEPAAPPETQGSAAASRPSVPAGTWVLGTRQPTFARDLLIGPAEPIRVDAEDRMTPLVPAADPWTRPSTVWALTTRLSTKKDFEKEDGSAGPRDALLRPLVHVLDKDGTPKACPLLAIDRLRGSDAGARWVLAPSDAPLTSAEIRRAVAWALDGAFELDARPVHACIEVGEVARVRVVVRTPWIRNGERPPDRALVTLLEPGGRTVGEAARRVDLTGPPEQRFGEIALSGLEKRGLYTALVEVPETSQPVARVMTGFWVRDDALLMTGAPLTVSRDWLRRGGAVFPVVGTTYMASDVHRKFLFEPNPALWDRDFAAMRAHGVNFVRTGLWTGWQRAMLDPGAVDEGVLRALDAFILTAARNGIVVCFNFFAFLPPGFGAANPYLDPRALEGQKAFLAAVARRYRGSPWVHYDLINEPSYAPPELLWQNRPIGDDHEKRAFTEWVRARHGSDQVKIRDAWRDPQGDLWTMPKGEEFQFSMTREHRRPRKAADFHRFTNDAVAGWAADLRRALRQAGGDVLVTLGQDEGGTWLRPTPQVFGEHLDYTSVHTWWNNDDLLWDGVLTKVEGKPNVVQETGLMRLEDADGFPWRTPEEAARLLERKFALAFAARGCGAIQWAWNVNPVMPVENESVIGILRPDGTAKPEIAILRDFAAFFAEAAPYLDDYEPEPVALVLPHSRLYMGRPQGFDGTKTIVRVLAESFGVVPRAISEMHLTDASLADAKLVIVPSAEALEPAAGRALLAASRRGTRILVIGPLTGDPYGRPIPELTELGVHTGTRALALHEPTNWAPDPDSRFVTFDGGRSEWLRAADGPPLTELDHGPWHEPLPLEFAREPGALRRLLGAALTAAGVEARPGAEPLTLAVLPTRTHALVVAVNESSSEAARPIAVGAFRGELRVPAGGTRALLIELATGAVRARR